MKEFAILFIIFGVLLILEGIANCHGHRPNIVRGGYIYKKMTKSELTRMGRYLIVIGSSLSVGCIPCFFFKEESIVPVIIMIAIVTISIIIYNKTSKNK